MARSFQKRRISQKCYLKLINWLFCIPSMRLPLEFYLKDVIFFFTSSLTSSAVLVALFKIGMLVYITPRKISVPRRVIFIWESYQVKFSYLYLPLFYEQS